MPNSSRFSGGFVACFMLGLFVCAAGLATAHSIKSGKVECAPTSTLNDNEAVKPTTNAVAVCIAASEAESQAKVTSQSTVAFGCILGGVAIMIAGIGFSIMSSSAPLSQPGGPRPPMPVQQPQGQFPAPGQPYPYPPQERPQS
jgi:hypothetical protein